MEAGSVFYANVATDTGRADGHWQGFPVVSRSFSFYRELCERHGLLMQDLGELGDLGHRSGAAHQDSQRMLCITAQNVVQAQAHAMASPA
jgi:hypothetical protein